MNLFDTLDGFFEGLVFFGYNVFRTFLTLLLHPFRGPIRLFVARQAVGKQQISSQTTLLLAALGIIWWASAQRDEFQWIILPRFPTAPDLPQVKTFWPVFAAASFLTIAIDVSFRLIFAVRYRNNRLRRRMFLAIVEYSLSSIFVGLLIVMSVFGTIADQQGIDPPPPYSGYITGGIIAIVILLALTYGLAAPGYLLGRGLRGRAIQPRGARNGLLVKVFTIASCIPVIMLALVPTAFGSWTLFASVVAAQRDERDHPQVLAAGLRCIITEGKLAVELGLSNDTDRTVFIDSAKVDVVMGYYGTGTPHDTFDYFDDRLGFLTVDGSRLGTALIKPHDAVMLRGSTVGFPEPRNGQELCALRLVDSAAELKGSYTSAKPASQLFYVRAIPPVTVARVSQVCDGTDLLGLPADTAPVPTLKGRTCGK